MAVPPDGGFEIAKSGLQVLNNLATIIIKAKESEKSGTPSRLSYSDVVKHMGAEIHQRAIELRNEIRDMKLNVAKLRDMGLDVDLPLAEVRKQSWFYRVSPFAPHKLLRNFGTRCTSIAAQSEDIFADVLAVANCREAEEEIAQAVASARQVVGTAADAAHKAAPMSNVVDDLLAEAQALVDLTSGL